MPPKCRWCWRRGGEENTDEEGRGRALYGARAAPGVAAAPGRLVRGGGDEGADVEAEEDDHDGRVTTTATFDEPGSYLLLVQAVDNALRDFEFHCCWTNGFVEVVVTP